MERTQCSLPDDFRNVRGCGRLSVSVRQLVRPWVYNHEKMQRLLAEGRIVQPSPGAVPRYKRYLDEVKGIAIGDSWDDIFPINSMARERLGYPTQKPEALLERIIAASSNEGDTVLDPFCGCGTAVAVAQRLNRKWIGIDITYLAITLMKHRLHTAYGEAIKDAYQVIGEPVSVTDAAALAAEDPYQFQWWALGLVNARPVEQKKGADRGIDGRIFFHDEAESGKTKQIIISVKAGNTGPAHVRDLRGVVDREKAAMGLLITMEDPTAPMRKEAATRGSTNLPGEPSTRTFRFSPWANCWKARRLTPRPAETFARSRKPRGQAGNRNTSRRKCSRASAWRHREGGNGTSADGV